MGRYIRLSKWRIQRNCITKHYRLLDNWDIRRAGGSFEQCSRALTRCAEIFQLTPPKTKAVVLLHELAGNKNQFNQMVKMAESAGFPPLPLIIRPPAKNCGHTFVSLNCCSTALNMSKKFPSSPRESADCWSDCCWLPIRNGRKNQNRTNRPD